MRLALFLLLLLQAPPQQAITFILDDAHPATAMIQGYRWTLDGVKFSTKIRVPPPCVDCLTRTYTLAAGTHALIVTPYTAKGDLLSDAVTYDVRVEVAGTATEQTIHISLTEKPK